MRSAVRSSVMRRSAQFTRLRPRPIPSKERALDAVRGIGSFTVFLWHFVELLNSYSSQATFSGLFVHLVWLLRNGPLAFLCDGELAVKIFFVLSGYVLSLGFFINGADGYGAKSTIRRLPRLFFPAVGSIALSHLLFANDLYFHRLVMAEVPGLDFTRALQDFNFVPSWHLVFRDSFLVFFRDGMGNQYNRALWTMSGEFAGSILVFCFFSVFRGAKHRGRLILPLTLWFIRFPNYTMLSFVVGMGICELRHNSTVTKFLSNAKRARAVSLLLGVLVVVYLTVINRIPLSPFTKIGGASLVVMAALFSGGTKAVLMLRPFQFLGKISFSMYVLHLPVIFSVGMATFLYVFRATQDYSWSLLVSFAASTTVLILSSIVYTKWVDDKSIRLSSRIAKRILGT